MDIPGLGARIRNARLKKGMTQENLAECADIGTTYLSDIERGVKMPSLTTFIKILEILDISADYVLSGELEAGKCHVYDELTNKLENLTPKQRQCVADIIDAYIKSL